MLFLTSRSTNCSADLRLMAKPRPIPIIRNRWSKTIWNQWIFIYLYLDKQQELDLPSLRVDDSESARLSTTPNRKVKDGNKDVSLAVSGMVSSSSSTISVSGGTVNTLSAKSGATPSSSSSPSSSSHVGRTMSHISGVKRPLSHSNSVTSEKVAKYGVDTPNEHELGKVFISTHIYIYIKVHIYSNSSTEFGNPPVWNNLHVNHNF